MATQQPAKGRTLSGALGTMPRANAQTRQQMIAGMQGGNVYAGGSPNFDEMSGQYRQPPHTGSPVYIPENPQQPPHSGSPIGIPENRRPVKGPGFQGPLQRVSPGIYRNASGDLVNSSGGRLPGNVYRQPGYAQYDPNRRPATEIVQGAMQGVGAAFGGGENYQPMPRPGMGGGWENIGNPQPMPRPVLGNNPYGNFAGAGQPMPRPGMGDVYQQAMEDAQLQPYNQQLVAGALPQAIGRYRG